MHFEALKGGGTKPVFEINKRINRTPMPALKDKHPIDLPPKALAGI